MKTDLLSLYKMIVNTPTDLSKSFEMKSKHSKGSLSESDSESSFSEINTDNKHLYYSSQEQIFYSIGVKL